MSVDQKSSGRPYARMTMSYQSQKIMDAISGDDPFNGLSAGSGSSKWLERRLADISVRTVIDLMTDAGDTYHGMPVKDFFRHCSDTGHETLVDHDPCFYRYYMRDRTFMSIFGLRQDGSLLTAVFKDCGLVHARRQRMAVHPKSWVERSGRHLYNLSRKWVAAFEDIDATFADNLRLELVLHSAEVPVPRWGRLYAPGRIHTQLRPEAALLTDGEAFPLSDTPRDRRSAEEFLAAYRRRRARIPEDWADILDLDGTRRLEDIDRFQELSLA